MDINIKFIAKIIKRIILIILILVVVNIILVIVGSIINSYFFSFKENKISDNKYLKLFNLNYQQDMVLSSPCDSKLSGFSYFYKIKSSEICIMELNQYSNINIKDIYMKNYLLEKENNSFTYFKTSIISHDYPYLTAGLYIKFNKPKQINLYIQGGTEKTIKDDNSLYVKFIGNLFQISSTEKYAELSCGFGMNPAPIELLILKKDNKTYFILKYSVDENNTDNISLLDLINME